MLDYGWGTGNPSSIMLSAEQTGVRDSEPAGQGFDPYATQTTSFIISPETHFATDYLPFLHPATHFPSFYDGASASYHHLQPPSGYVMVPKSEQMLEFNSRIGLNLGLGGRTYFASDGDDFVNRLYRRSRMFDPGSLNSPRCQAEGCNADLTHAKHYHRRHKVCEFHSKASTVVVAGLTQRFCQQCSRFHLLSEFDNGKRSCRKRLDDHNRRRRKSHQTNSNNNQESSSTNNKSQLQPRSPPCSGTHSSTRVSVDGFGHGGQASSSTASTGYTLY